MRSGLGRSPAAATDQVCWRAVTPGRNPGIRRAFRPAYSESPAWRRCTAAGIARLVATGRLGWNTEAFPFGNNQCFVAGFEHQTRTRTITVQQLVLRRSGLRRDWDGGNDMRSIAVKLGITTTPTRDQLVRYMFGEPLVFSPGTKDHSPTSRPSIPASPRPTHRPGASPRSV